MGEHCIRTMNHYRWDGRCITCREDRGVGYIHPDTEFSKMRQGLIPPSRSATNQGGGGGGGGDGDGGRGYGHGGPVIEDDFPPRERERSPRRDHYQRGGGGYEDHHPPQDVARRTFDSR